MNFINPGRFTTIALFGAVAAYGAAKAATVPEQPTRLPEMVVATNRVEAPREIAATAVTTLPSERIDEIGILSTVDLPRIVPNLSGNHTGLRSFSDTYAVRGLGNTEFLSDPAVVLYVDDAPFGSVVSYTTDLLAIDTIDVYRGPQGTRFGRNAEAGVINIVTRQPAERFEGEASVSVATFETWRYRGFLAGPILSNKLHFSLAGQYARSDGYIRNRFLHAPADEREAINTRAALQWKATEDWHVDFSATSDNFNDGLGIVSLAGDPRETSSDFKGKVDEDINSQSLRVRGKAANLAITSITARRDFRLDPFKLDLDFSPFAGNTGVVRYVQTQWSEELRLRPVESAELWDWHSGFFFSTAETDIDRINSFFVPPFFSGRDVNQSVQNSDTYALFGEGTYTTFEKLDITLGLRFDYTVRGLERTRDFTFGSPPPLEIEEDYFNVLPKLSLAWHGTETLLLYGSTGLGFKPGGFSPFIDPPNSPEYDTEKTWTSEVGVKATWLDGKLSANAAAFYYDITDYQVEQFVPPGFDFTIINAPSATSYGGEFDLVLRPAAGWEFSSFFGYTHARLDRYTDPFRGITVRDTAPPFVAEFNGGVAGQYKHSTGLFARLHYTAIGETFYDARETSAFRQPAYSLLSARCGIERQYFSVFLFGENLTDTDYYTKKIPPLNAGAPGRPFTFGVMALGRF